MMYTVFRILGFTIRHQKGKNSDYVEAYVHQRYIQFRKTAFTVCQII